LLYRKYERADGHRADARLRLRVVRISIPDRIISNRLSLVDRAFVRDAHVRGGTEKGWRWYAKASLPKQNTFSDFIAATEHLVTRKSLRRQSGGPGRLSRRLLDRACQQRPDLYAALIAEVRS